MTVRLPEGDRERLDKLSRDSALPANTIIILALRFFYDAAHPKMPSS